jgi:hypothetical protein
VRLLTESDAPAREDRVLFKERSDPMALPHFILLYVEEPQASADFYTRLLNRRPLDSSPNFVMFELSPNLRLGLWARRDVEPAPRDASDTGELAMAVGPPNRSKRSTLIGGAKAPPSCKNRLRKTSV